MLETVLLIFQDCPTQQLVLACTWIDELLERMPSPERSEPLGEVEVVSVRDLIQAGPETT